MTQTGRLRVVHIGKFYPPHVGGIETHLQALCGELQKFVDVTVVVANEGRDTTEATELGVRVVRVGTVLNLASAPFCPGMVRAIRVADAPLVHLHLPNPGGVIAYLGSRHRGRLVVTYHADTYRQKFLGKAFQPILQRALDKSTAIIVGSQECADTSPLLARYRSRSHIIPFGISLERFRCCDPTEVARIQERYGPRIAITVGRLVYYKGLQYLISVMGKVQGRLLIAGDGPLRSTLENQVRSAGLNGRVIFLGRVDDLVPYYHAADLFVLASVAPSEAFGIVQLEAMACGKPVINTSLPSGVPFVSLHEVTGITVPPKCREALADAINLLLNDPVRRGQYGNAARRRVEREFNLELMTQRTLRLYTRVTKSSIIPAPFREPTLLGINSEAQLNRSIAN